MKVFAFAILICLLDTCFCFGQSSKSLLREDFRWTNSVLPLGVAVEMQTSLTKLRKLIPAPTPMEVAWIDKEQEESERYSIRWTRLVSSREYLQNRLKLQLDHLDSLLGQLAELQTQETEMMLWCNVSVQLQAVIENFNSAIAALISANFLTERLDRETDLIRIGDDYTLVLKAAARNIQSKILLGYLVKQSGKSATVIY